MRRTTLLTLLLGLAAGEALAGPLAKAYIPTGNPAQIRAVQAAFKKVGSGNLGHLGHIEWTDSRSLIPLGMVMTPAEEQKLEALLSAEHADAARIKEVLSAMNLRARGSYAWPEAERLLSDQRHGRISDEQLDDAQTFAGEFLAVFGSYLHENTKAGFFAAAAALEQRRLKVREDKEVRIEAVMRDLAERLAEGSKTADGVAGSEGTRRAVLEKPVEGPVFLKILEQYGDYLAAALEKKDIPAFQDWLSRSYEAFESEYQPALDRLKAGPVGAQDAERIALMREDVSAYNKFLKSVMKEAGLERAAVTTSYKSVSPRELLGYSYQVDLNDAGRDRLLGLIESAAARGRRETWDIEANLPFASFQALETLRETDDPSLFKHLQLIGDYYKKALWKASSGSAEHRAWVERMLVSGFDGKVASLPQVWAVWAAAKDKVNSPADVVIRRNAGLEKMQKTGALAFLAGMALAFISWLAESPSGGMVAVFALFVSAVLSLWGVLRQDSIRYSLEKFKSMWAMQWRTLGSRLPWTGRPPQK